MSSSVNNRIQSCKTKGRESLNVFETRLMIIKSRSRQMLVITVIALYVLFFSKKFYYDTNTTTTMWTDQLYVFNPSLIDNLTTYINTTDQSYEVNNITTDNTSPLLSEDSDGVISYKLRVFEMGLPKTGTASLGTAFRMLGFKTAGWQGNLHDQWKATQNVSLVVEKSKKYEAFHDGPWHSIHPKIWMHVYPNAKFILLMRNETAWLNSMESHFSPRYDVNNIGDYLNYDWIYDREKARNDAIKMRHRQHNLVIDFFKNDLSKLLIMNTSELDWKPLCEFLNKKIPSKSFPVKNKSKRKNEE
eukprot:250517_1